MTRSFWRTLPRRSLFTFYFGVFATFSAFGFVVDLARLARMSLPALALTVFTAGLFSVLYASTGIGGSKRQWLQFPVIAFFHVASQIGIARVFRVPRVFNDPGADFLRQIQWRILLDCAGVMLCIAIGYTLFIIFFNREGEKYFRVRTELALAAEIHQHLVPRFHESVNGFEYYGESQASGEVGGDLVDLVRSPDGKVSVAYIADVSGHGVAPGLVMGMIKSAARMKLTEAAEQTSTLLSRLNTVLYPLKKPNMFATFGYVSPADRHVEYGLAGHHAILHYAAATGAVSELMVPNLPLGILPAAEFESSKVPLASGDVLLLITDGYLELEDDAGVEFGFDRMKELLARHGREPMEAIAGHIKAAAIKHGTQADDQSLLLVRKS